VYRVPGIRHLQEVVLRTGQSVRVCLLIVVFCKNALLMYMYSCVVRTIVYVTETCKGASNLCVVQTYQNRNLL
jgi:hypothetical protein